jgi:NIPSNAP
VKLSMLEQMTRRIVLSMLLLAGIMTGVASAQSRVFELRIYTANDGKLEALKARFRDYTTTIFKKHHMEVIAYWTPQKDDPKAKDTFIYILAHPSREAATKNWQEFRTDPEWTKVQAESEKDGALVKKVDSTFMDALPFSPMK